MELDKKMDLTSERKINPVLKVLLAGVYDPNHPLSKFRGCPHIIQEIWSYVVEYWKSLIQLPFEQEYDKNEFVISKVLEDYTLKSKTFFAPVFTTYFHNEKYNFPSLSGRDPININMMPFIVSGDFKSSKLPEFVQPYWSMIVACLQPEVNKARWHYWPRKSHPSDEGRIYYLTIQESYVEAGTSQRRPGLHVDSPGKVSIKNEERLDNDEGKGFSQQFRGHRWGMGCAHYTKKDLDWNDPDFDWLDWKGGDHLVTRDGIYLASSVEASCQVWNCSVTPEAVGKLGDIEYLRSALPKSSCHVLKAGQIYWITDRTPHESLPLKTGTNRQFFRLVTGPVSLWYKNHSTPNPLGVKPDPKTTRIVVGDKFSEEGVEIVVTADDPENVTKNDKVNHVDSKNMEQNLSTNSSKIDKQKKCVLS